MCCDCDSFIHRRDDIECVVLLISCFVCRLIQLLTISCGSCDSFICCVLCGTFICCVRGLFCTFMWSGWVSLLCAIGESVNSGKSLVGVRFVCGELGWSWSWL